MTTKTARAYYSTAVPHREVNDLYQASFGIPGQPPAWVEGADGRPKAFLEAKDAEIAGFRMMMSKLNRSRGVQSFGIKVSHGIRAGSGRMGSTHLVRGIRSFRSAPEPVTQEHTISSVFGKRS